MADIESLRAAANAALAASNDAPEDAALAAAAEKAAKALANAEAAEAKKNSKPVKMVKVRLLSAHDGHAPNSVLELTDAEAGALVAQGVADDHPAAVAYAESLG